MPHAGVNDTFDIRVKQRVDQCFVAVHVPVENLHVRQFAQTGDVKFTHHRMFSGRFPVEIRLAVLDVAEIAQFPTLESFHMRRIGFGHIPGTIDLIVHADKHALAAGFGASRQADRIQQVHRAVGADRRCWAHGADQHHRLVALDDQIEEIGGFFKGIRAMGDHNAVYSRTGQQFVNPFCQFQPYLVRHRKAANVGDLLAGNIGILLDFRDSVDQDLHADFTGIVPGHLRGAAAAAGNGSAGCQNHYIGQLRRQCRGKLR